MASKGIICISMNVSSLGKRLETLLSWGAHIYLLTEVRASDSMQKSLSRRAARMGYQAIWSRPPPSSETFEVVPGGVSIMVKLPLTVSKMQVSHIALWEGEGRALAGLVTFGQWRCMCVALYGYARSHPKHGMNEAGLLQAALWVEQLTIPVLWGGDLNETCDSSAMVALSKSLNHWRLSCDEATTRTKKGAMASKLVNGAFLDLGPEVHVRRDLWLSDHYPLQAQWSIPDRCQQVWNWPKPMACKERINEHEWTCWPQTYAEWAEYGTSWLAKVFHLLHPKLE